MEGKGYLYAAQQFDWDEKKGLNMKEFFLNYWTQFPMLGVVLEGWYGQTRFDTYDNLQVVRIHGYTEQPRVVATDSNSPPGRFITIPVDTAVKFCVIRGHNTTEKMRTLPYILENHQLPVLVRMSCDENHVLKMGTSHYMAGQFGNLLITEQYTEYYLMINCIDGTTLDQEMRPEGNLMFLTENLSMTPVTGVKDRPQADFQRYMAALATQASRCEYDTRRGNPDFAEYHTKDIDRKTGDGGIPTVNPPAIPGMDDQEDETYIEMPPQLPPRPPGHPAAPPDSPRSPTTTKPMFQTADTNTGAGKTKHRAFHGIRDLLKRATSKESLLEDIPERPPKLETELITKPQRDKEISPPSKHLKRHKTLEKHDGPIGKPNDYQKTVYGSGNTKQAGKAANESNVKPVSGESESSPAPPRRPHTSVPAIPKDLQLANIKDEKVQQQYQALGKGSATPTYLRVQSQPPESSHVQDESQESMYELDPEPEEAQSEYCVPYQDMRGTAKMPGKTQYNETKGKPPVKRPAESTAHARDSVGLYEDMTVTSPTGNASMTSTKNKPLTSLPSVQQKEQQRTGKNPVSVTKLAKQPTTDSNPTVPKNTRDRANNGEKATQVNVKDMNIGELCDVLKQLKLDKHVQRFRDDTIDGTILSSLKSEEYQTELGMTRLEALKLAHFVKSGHIPK